MSDLVCDREFLIAADGQERRVVVEWMRPRRDRGDWRCDWAIHWPDRAPEQRYSIGVDSAQALLLAMGSARGRLEDLGAPVRWLEGNDTLGLPGLPTP